MAAWNNRSQRGMGMQDEMLEQENQRLGENLSNKVSRLKNFAFDLQTEAEDSNVYLNGMDTDFDSSQGLLSGSVNRLSNMVSSGKNNRKLCCYIIITLVVVFLLFYFVLSRIRSPTDPSSSMLKNLPSTTSSQVVTTSSNHTRT